MDKTNPVVMQALSISGALIFFKALLNLAIAMRWLELADDEEAAAIDFIETALPIVIVWIGAWWAARRTTSLKNPTDVDGTQLTRPDNTPAIPHMASMHKEANKINERINDRRIQR